MEAVFHTSDECMSITEDQGKPRESRVINAGRKLRCCTEEEETTDCRKGTPGGDPLFVNICRKLKLEVLTVEDHENCNKVHKP